MKRVQLSENAYNVAKSRYFLNGEDWEGCCRRVAYTIATPEKDKTYGEKFAEMISEMSFVPAGRILRNSGRPKGSILNCFHLSVGDSIEEIGECLKNSLILWSEGGGVGLTFSNLRPKGDIILGKGGQSSGLVSFMEVFNSAADKIESGGARRAAALALVDISHPEVLDFIDSKLTHGILKCFNISVGINNDFLEAVEGDKDWSFKFKQKHYGTLKARDIWNKMIKNMVACGEPGIINWSNFAKNNSWYFASVSGTNPCGETCLSHAQSCDLGSLVLPAFITGNVNTNWKKLESTIRLAVRFLDNVIDVNKYPLKEVDIQSHNARRIGIGVMGLAEYLFAKGVVYGSEKAVAETEKLMRFIRDCSYEASVELAVEKGSFPKFDSLLYGKSSFIRKLPAPLRMDIKKHGVRNCTLMAMQPGGTISLVADVNGGIEPVFSKAFIRKDRVGERVYIHPKYQGMLENNQEIPDWFVDSFDIEPKDHFEMQVACQKYCDGSVSKTINLPAHSTEEDLSELLLEYATDLKGVTVYRDGSRDGQILNRMSEVELKDHLSKNKKVEHSLEESQMSCATGACDL